MPPVTKLGPLDDKEKAEFDNTRYDEIQECKDVKKLMRLDAYMREQGYPSTADAVVARLRELGQRTANSEMDPEEARLLAEDQARASADIAAWTTKQRVTDAALEAASRESAVSNREGSNPPVRAPARATVEPAVPPAKQPPVPKPDSGVGTHVRSGRDYYERWEKKAAVALEEIERDETGASAAAGAGAAAAAASTAGLARSPELTERLLELNRGASAAERLVLSSAEKSKGNDHFRAKEYAEAVEHYTLALGLRGAAGEASLFGNRAAAYIRLKMWDAAEQDSSAALEADPGMIKAFIRRAAARLEMGKLAEAVADCDSALALQPDCAEAEGLRARAEKLRQEAGMKRMAIEEVDDEEEVEDEVAEGAEAVAAAGQRQQQQGAGPARKKLVVVEESDSDDSEGEKAVGAQEKPVAAAAAVPPLPPPAAAAAPAAPAPAPAPASAVSNGDASPKPATAATAAPAAAHPPAPASVAAPPAPPSPAPEPARPAAVATPAASPALRPPPALPPPPAQPAPTSSALFDAAVDGIKQEGNREFKENNFVRAAQLYSEALALAPDLPTLYLNRSMARLRSELPVKALRDACQAVALDPGSYKALHKRARAKMQLRLWESALADLQRCHEMIPPKDKSRVEVGRELDEADQHVTRAAKRAADRAAAAAAAAARPQRVTSYAKARVTIEEHEDEKADDDPDSPLLPRDEAAAWEVEAVQLVGQLRLRGESQRSEWLRQRDEEANTAFQRELLAWEAARERAEAAAAEEAAIAAAAAAASSNGTAAGSGAAGGNRSVDVIKNEGNEHLKAKRYRDAEVCYRECLQLDPASLAVRLNLLVLLNETQRWTEAEAAADEALELLSASKALLSPDQASNMRSKVHHRRANARRALGRLLEAQTDLRAAKALMGQSPALDVELESLGRQILAEGDAAAAAAAPPPVATAPPQVAAVPEPVAAVPELTAPAHVPAPAAVGPKRQQDAPAPAPAGPAAAAAAPAQEAAASSSGGGGSGSSAAPARRKMAIQVVSDDSDDEAAATEPAALAAQPAASSWTPTSTPAGPGAPASATKPPEPATAAVAAPPPTATSSRTPPPAPAAGAPAVSTAAATAAPSAPPPAPSAAGSAISGDAGNTAEGDKLRDEGNRLYGVGNYVRAMDFYSRSIRACAQNPAAYCNRAFVYLHLKRPADALLDAEAAIEQAGGSYPKAQLRRALALRDLGRLADAMLAIRQLLDATPGDEALLEEMQKLQRMAGPGPASAGSTAAPAAAAAASVQGQQQNPVVNGAAAAKAPVQAAPVMHKILVEEADSDEDEPAPSQDAGSTAAAASPAPAAAAPAAATAVAPSPAASTSGASSPVPGSATSTSSSTAAAAASMAAAGSPSSSASSSAAAAAASGNRNLHEAAAAKAAAALASKAPKKPKPPKNAHELEQALKGLAGHPAVLYDYVRSLDPTAYKGIIKANLSVKMIQAIIDTARHVMQQIDGAPGQPQAVQGGPQPDDVAYAVRSLEELTGVARFEMTYGLCAKGMKEDLRALTSAMAAAGHDVSLLKKSLKL